jgi:predicted ester cyclase
MVVTRRMFAAGALGAAPFALPVRAARAAGIEKMTDSAAANSEILDRYIAAFNAHDVDAFRNVIAEGYIQHNGRSGPGLAGLQATFRGYFETFPDFHIQIGDRIFSGDKVVARATLTATHSRPVQLAPSGPVFQPTGKALAWGDIDIWRVADGKFAEHWDQSDLVGLARQLRED